jgi:hypothetical protein
MVDPKFIKLSKLYPSNGNSTRFGVYKCDFGWEGRGSFGLVLYLFLNTMDDSPTDDEFMSVVSEPVNVKVRLMKQE